MTSTLIALEDYITIQEAVYHSGYTEHYIRRMVWDGRLQAVKADYTWLIKMNALEAYVRDARTSADRRRGPRMKRI